MIYRLAQASTRSFSGFALALLLALGTAAVEAGDQSLTPLELPGGAGGIGFDDINFSPELNRLLVPAGRTGKLFLIDGATKQIETVSGFSMETGFGGGHGEGITSADAKAGLIAVTDRTARQLVVLDASSRKRIASAKLATEPDYIRIVKSKNEIWVTQPSESRIEIFSLGEDRHPKHSAFIAVEGGPESLVIDDDHGRAFANTWKDETLAVDLNSRSIVSRWPNGCSGSRGLTFDPDDTRLFVGCKEGKLTVLDASSGKQLGSASSGDGVDIIAYDAKLKHAYLPGARSATMAVIAIEATGTTRVLETAHTAPGAHCVASDGQGKAFVCDPQKGRLLLFDDRALEAH